MFEGGLSDGFDRIGGEKNCRPRQVTWLLFSAARSLSAAIHEDETGEVLCRPVFASFLDFSADGRIAFARASAPAVIPGRAE